MSNHSEVLDLNFRYKISLRVQNLNKIEVKRKALKLARLLFQWDFGIFILNLYTNKQHLLRVTDQANVSLKTANTGEKK